MFMQVDGAAVDLRARPYELTAAPGGVGLITLKLRPIGMHLYIANNSQLINLIHELLAILTALHMNNRVHRDIRMDNLVHGPAGWVLIDWELAGLAGQHVFWSSTYLPPEVKCWPDALYNNMRLMASGQDHPAIQCLELRSNEAHCKSADQQAFHLC